MIEVYRRLEEAGKKRNELGVDLTLLTKKKKGMDECVENIKREIAKIPCNYTLTQWEWIIKKGIFKVLVWDNMPVNAQRKTLIALGNMKHGSFIVAEPNNPHKKAAWHHAAIDTEAGNWVPWFGGDEDPHIEMKKFQMITILRDGTLVQITHSEILNWKHHGHSSDIMAYVVLPNNMKQAKSLSNGK